MVYSFFLHYGISAVLVFMFCMVAIMLDKIEISNKTHVDVFAGKFPACKAYIGKTDRLLLKESCCINIDVTHGGTLSFTIQDLTEEADFFVVRLVCMDNADTLIKAFSGNSKLSGYVYTNKIKLWELIFFR